MSIHEWRDIPGWEGLYRASNFGSIFSMRNRLYLKQGLNKVTGYFQVTLCRDGKMTSSRVHRLVALAFLGPCPKGQQVMHGPCGKLINSVNNLKYGTASQNMEDWWNEGKVWQALISPANLS